MHVEYLDPVPAHLTAEEVARLRSRSGNQRRTTDTPIQLSAKERRRVHRELRSVRADIDALTKELLDAGLVRQVVVPARSASRGGDGFLDPVPHWA